MKKPVQTLFFSTLFILGLLLTSNSATAQSTERIKVIIGTRSHPTADGKGCEGEKGICFIITFRDQDRLHNSGVAEIQDIDGKLLLNILQDPEPAMDFENTFHVYEDKEIPADIAQEMGYSGITIRKGEYRLDKNKNRLGSVLLNADFRF